MSRARQFLSASGVNSGTATNRPLEVMDPLVFEARVASGLHDAEHAASGAMYSDSSELELIDDPTFNGGGQTAGLRFTGLDIPAGAVITGAGERTVGHQCTRALSIKEGW